MTDLLESPDSLGLVSICRIYRNVTGWLSPIPRIKMFSSKTFGVEKQNLRRQGMIFGNSHFSSVCAHCAVGKHNFWREFYRIGCGWVVVCCCVQKGGDYWTVNPLFTSSWTEAVVCKRAICSRLKLHLPLNNHSPSSDCASSCGNLFNRQINSHWSGWNTWAEEEDIWYLWAILRRRDLSFEKRARSRSSQDASAGKAQFFPRLKAIDYKSIWMRIKQSLADLCF